MFGDARGQPWHELDRDMLLLTGHRAPAVASPPFPDSRRTGPEPKGGVGKGWRAL